MYSSYSVIWTFFTPRTMISGTKLATVSLSEFLLGLGDVCARLWLLMWSELNWSALLNTTIFIDVDFHTLSHSSVIHG